MPLFKVLCEDQGHRFHRRVVSFDRKTAMRDAVVLTYSTAIDAEEVIEKEENTENIDHNLKESLHLAMALGYHPNENRGLNDTTIFNVGKLMGHRAEIATMLVRHDITLDERVLLLSDFHECNNKIKKLLAIQ